MLKHRRLGSTSNLIGSWKRTTESSCAEKYPVRVTFSTGTYRGTRGPGQGIIWWDAGIYRFEAPNTLVLSVANDELVRYRIELHGDDFDVTDAEGCRFTYRRESSSG